MIAPQGITLKCLIDHVMELAGVGPGDVFYDLGCGDGRMLIAAARRGARAVGIEVRDDLYRVAVENVREAGLEGRVRVVKGNIFNHGVGEATVVYLYLTVPVNRLLAPKLSRELRPGTRVVALDYPVQPWRPFKVRKVWDGLMERTLYLYVIGVSDRPGDGMPVNVEK